MSRRGARAALAALAALAGLGVGASAFGAAPPSAPCGAFAAPPPRALRALAFGHERALARALWSRGRVAHGACLARRRRFDGALAYVDAALALDPSFREPYRYVEAFVVAGVGRPSSDELGGARRVFGEGVRRFPHDAELRGRAGAFLAFVAPAYLEPVEAARWRAEGLALLAPAPRPDRPADQEAP